MNLTEQLGGYENAKKELNSPSNTNVFFQCEIEQALLGYHRKHNIFELGDKVVWISGIAPSDPRLFEIEEDLGENPDTWSLRHTIPAEIQAGKRLD